jgi:diacylglycerol kinase family enzyme
LFEVTLIRKPTNPIELQEIIAALLIEQVDTKHMYTFRSGHITFESIEEIPWTLDGEYGGTHDMVTIDNLNKQLQIMVPEEHIEDISGEVSEEPEELEELEEPEESEEIEETENKEDN